MSKGHRAFRNTHLVLFFVELQETTEAFESLIRGVLVVSQAPAFGVPYSPSFRPRSLLQIETLKALVELEGPIDRQTYHRSVSVPAAIVGGILLPPFQPWLVHVEPTFLLWISMQSMCSSSR